MARDKRPTHTTPSFSDAGHRDLPAAMARKAVTLADRQALVNLWGPNEIPIPTDWVTPQLEQARKPKRQRDLEEVLRIVTDRLAGRPVTAQELKWANEFGEQEKRMEEAEVLEAMKRRNQMEEAEVLEAMKCRNQLDLADYHFPQSSASVEDHEDNNEGGNMGDNQVAASILPSRNSLTADNLENLPAAAGNKEDTADKDNKRASSNPLSEVSDVSALLPFIDLKKRRSRRNNESASDSFNSDSSSDGESEKIREEKLSRTLDTLEYDDNPPSRPYWLTGLSKPLPHPLLTSLEDFEVETRLWVDELDRIKQLRSNLPTSNGNGEWHYNHFGTTEEVYKREDARAKGLYARGVWTLMETSTGDETERRLDEYSLGLDGASLGWGHGMTFEEMKEPEVYDAPEEREDVADVRRGLRGIDGLYGAGDTGLKLGVDDFPGMGDSGDQDGLEDGMKE